MKNDYILKYIVKVAKLVKKLHSAIYVEWSLILLKKFIITLVDGISNIKYQQKFKNAEKVAKNQQKVAQQSIYEVNGRAFF